MQKVLPSDRSSNVYQNTRMGGEMTADALMITYAIGGIALRAGTKVVAWGASKFGGFSCSVAQDELLSLSLKNSKAEFLFNSWDKGTFPNRMQSIKYHMRKHGNSQSYEEYTQKAIDFFKVNKEKASSLMLKNGKPGYSIKLRKEDSSKIGGFWTEEGKIITFWGD